VITNVGNFGENNRIQKFDSNGNFITKWGTSGSGDGQFVRPASLAVDASGNVFVVDEGNNRIQKSDSNGNFLTKWGTTGTDNGQFEEPTGIALDSSGNVYVVDRGNSRNNQ
jgi:DNA-binding beta-propeller fold protein YncE